MEDIKEKAYFNIGNNHYYEGYHVKDETWNGWAMPYFNKYIADLLAHNCSTRNFLITYISQDDCYIVITKENDTITDESIIEKLVIDTKEGKKEVYDFASIGWTWDAYTIDEVKDMTRAYIIHENKEIETIETIEIDY